jgi:hypothetical protein
MKMVAFGVTHVSANDPMSKTHTGAPKPTPTPRSAFVWFSNSLAGQGSVNTLTLVTPIGLAVGLGSLAAAFIPSKSSTNTRTKTFPTSPPPGTVNTTTSTSAFNPSSENTIAAAVFTGGAAYTASQVSVPTGDLQTWIAVRLAIMNAVKRMNCPANPKNTPATSQDRYPALPSQGAPPAMAPFCQGWMPAATPRTP